MSDAELRRVNHLVGQLRRSIDSLRRDHRNCPAVRRLHNAVELLELDLTDGLPATCADRREDRGVVLIPDTPHDPELWRDADDEGIGGFRRSVGSA
ncbi:hypothetical protein [Saccharopolyspora cebuensis]|uniref:Uncharacterized protein n=1 Tax=Saccharopolyspora cebuensis TaxID=418759 RepID=A0ABV4CKB6_9PSEU